MTFVIESIPCCRTGILHTGPVSHQLVFRGEMRFEILRPVSIAAREVSEEADLIRVQMVHRFNRWGIMPVVVRRTEIVSLAAGYVGVVTF